MFKCICVYLFNGRIQRKFIGLFLCFTEDNSSAVAAAVHPDDVTDHSCTLGPVARYGQMLERHDRHGAEGLIDLNGSFLIMSH